MKNVFFILPTQELNAEELCVHYVQIINFSARKHLVNEYVEMYVNHSLGLESIASIVSSANDEKTNQTLFFAKGRK